MCKVSKRPFLPFVLASLALAIGVAYGSAHAAVDASHHQAATVALDQAASATTRSEMAACKKLPLSQRGICADQAGYGQPVMRHSLSPAQRKTLGQENARYEAAMAACKRLPVSERTTCVSIAGVDTTLAAAK